MLVRYLVIDRRGRVHEVRDRLIEAAWDRDVCWDASTPEDPWGPPCCSVRDDLVALTGGNVLRLLTAILDRHGRLARLYYLQRRLDVNGLIRRKTVLLRARQLVPGGLLRTVPASTALERMRCRWPASLWFQVASVLGLPSWEVCGCRIGFGGPLALADAMRLTIEEAYAELRARLLRECKEV